MAFGLCTCFPFNLQGLSLLTLETQAIGSLCPAGNVYAATPLNP